MNKTIHMWLHCKAHFATTHANGLDFSWKNEGLSLGFKGASTMEKPKQEEALFSPVAILR